METTVRPPLARLAFDDDELIVDNFAGGGGASVGIRMALDRSVDIAINHDQKALAMHRINHPETQHLCEDIWAVDIKSVVSNRRVGLAWFSPDCKHFSKAKGGKPVEKKIRGLAWIALRWAGLVRPRVIILENVEEFRDWGPVLPDGQPCKRRKGMTFKRWCTQLRNLGYTLDYQERRACWDGAPTIRKRLFVVARCDGQPIVWPEHTHGKGLLPYRTAAECIDWSIPCPSIFLSKKDGRTIGVNRPLAEATMERIAKGVWKYVINAADPFIVNLTHHGSDRNESLTEPMRTITGARRGEKALVVPSLVQMAHGGRDEALNKPLRTICTEKGGSRALIVPTLIQTGYGERPGQEPRVPGIEKPLGTIVSTGKHALIAPVLMSNNTNNVPSSPLYPLKTITTGNRHFEVAAFLAQHNNHGRGDVNVGRDARQPISTITTSGSHQAVVASSIMKMRGTNIGQDAREPLHTVSAGGQHFAQVDARLMPAKEGDWPDSAYRVAAFLIKYYGTDQDPELDGPLHSVTTKDRFAVVMVTIHGEDFVIVDIGMRMLAPRELFTAQGFPVDYIIERGIRIQGLGDSADLFSAEIGLTRTDQIRMCGNSVSPHPAAAIVRAQFTPQAGIVAA